MVYYAYWVSVFVLCCVVVGVGSGSVVVVVVPPLFCSSSSGVSRTVVGVRVHAQRVNEHAPRFIITGIAVVA
eukprot:1457522-Rhodomonas_salina.1